jgi:DNA-binding CsgD family transcriptional regulator
LGASREDLPDVLGVADSSVKTHVKHLLHKTGDASLDEALVRALREVVEKSYRPPP